MDNRHLAGNGGEIKGLVTPWHIYGWSRIGLWDHKLAEESSDDLLPPLSPDMRDVPGISFILGRRPAARERTGS